MKRANLFCHFFSALDCGPDSTFNSNVEVYISCRNADLTGVAVNNLTPAWSDEALKKWINLGGGTVDSNTMTVSATVTHFTEYALATRYNDWEKSFMSAPRESMLTA